MFSALPPVRGRAARAPWLRRVVGIDDDTLRKHFREEIDTGAARANARVAAFLFEQATGQRGDSSAAVTAGRAFGKTMVIDSGLAPGDTVVTDGQLRLFPGAQIKMVDPGKLEEGKS